MDLFSNNEAEEFRFYEYNSLWVCAKYLKLVNFNAGWINSQLTSTIIDYVMEKSVTYTIQGAY